MPIGIYGTGYGPSPEMEATFEEQRKIAERKRLRKERGLSIEEPLYEYDYDWQRGQQTPTFLTTPEGRKQYVQPIGPQVRGQQQYAGPIGPPPGGELGAYLGSFFAPQTTSATTGSQLVKRDIKPASTRGILTSQDPGAQAGGLQKWEEQQFGGTGGGAIAGSRAGAQQGMQYGGGYGAAIGAVLGAGVGAAEGYFGRKQKEKEIEAELEENRMRIAKERAQLEQHAFDTLMGGLRF